MPGDTLLSHVNANLWIFSLTYSKSTCQNLSLSGVCVSEWPGSPFQALRVKAHFERYGKVPRPGSSHLSTVIVQQHRHEVSRWLWQPVKGLLHLLSMQWRELPQVRHHWHRKYAPVHVSPVLVRHLPQESRKKLKRPGSLASACTHGTLLRRVGSYLHLAMRCAGK